MVHFYLKEVPPDLAKMTPLDSFCLPAEISLTHESNPNTTFLRF